MKNIFHLYILFGILLISSTFSINITKSTFKIDGSIQDIVWCGQEEVAKEFDSSLNDTQPVYLKKTVFIVSGKGIVYRSVDEGKNFENMKPIFETASSQYAKVLHNKTSSIGTIIKIYQGDADPQYVLFHGNEGISYLSEDCGANVQAFNHPENFVEFKLNPIDKKLIMAASKIKCDDLSPDYCSMTMDLYYSEKMGLNWRKIQSSIIEFAWACSNKYYKHLIPIERIIITRADEQSKNLSTQVMYSDNGFINFMILSKKGYRFFLTAEFLYILEADDLAEKRFSLKICPNYYRDYKLSPVELPIQRLKDHSFTILDSTESSIFINVNHYGDDAKFGNVYVSNYEGKKFVLSLLHNVRDDKGFCDFEKVKSLEGVYIANNYEHIEAEKFKNNYNYFSNSADKKKHESIDSYKKSMISYDKGGFWYPIPAPEYDIDGKKLDCHGECSLHLRGFTDKFSNPLYSSESAIGIIMGVGNVGIYLSQKPEEVNTYLSRDGGHSWFQVDKGSYIYEIGDHGGLIVMADDNKPTKTIKYSWNEGMTWEYFTFSDEEIEVTNIIIEPMNMSLKFLIYGNKLNATGFFEGMIIFLDFSTMQKRVCSGLWNPGAEESDYEVWVPNSHDQLKCLFGKRMKYVRRKRNSDCFNGEDFEKKNIVDFCPCGEEDWECDFGFYRKTETKECLPISSEFQNKLNNFTEPENCTDYYEVPSGYRKIPGDYCVGGVDKQMAKQVRCSKAQKQSNGMLHSGNNNNAYQVNQASQHSYMGNLKIGLFAILMIVVVYIFREYLIDLAVKFVDAAKGLGRKTLGKKNDGYNRDYERVGAPLKNLNDEDDDDNI